MLRASHLPPVNRLAESTKLGRRSNSRSGRRVTRVDRLLRRARLGLESRFVFAGTSSPRALTWHILAVARDALLVLDELVADRLQDVGSPRTESGHAVDDVGDQVKPIEVVSTAMSNGLGEKSA